MAVSRVTQLAPFPHQTIPNYHIGLWLGHIAPLTPVTSQLRLRLFLGAAVFLFGFFLNKHADKLLSRLRKPGETDYKIPHGNVGSALLFTLILIL